MPDTDLMPRGRAIAAAPAPPSGLVDVLARAGRRRRRRQAGAIATTFAACVAVLAITMAGNGVVDSLGVTPAQGGGATRTGTDLGGDPQNVTDGRHLPVPPDRSVPNASTDRQPAVRGPARPQPAPAAAAAQSRTSGGEVGPPHITTAYDATRGCGGAGPTAAKGWCGYYDGALTGRAGKRVELAQTLCRLPGNGTGTLKVDSGEQAKFGIRTHDNYSVWEWSKGRRFSRHGATFAVEAGTCLRWYVGWNVVDSAGHALAAGAYQLDARPTAYPSDATDPYVWADTQFLTFTVTS